MLIVPIVPSVPVLANAVVSFVTVGEGWHLLHGLDMLQPNNQSLRSVRRSLNHGSYCLVPNVGSGRSRSGRYHVGVVIHTTDRSDSAIEPNLAPHVVLEAIPRSASLS